MIKDLAPTIRKAARGLLASAPPEPGPPRTATTSLLVVRHGHAGDREKWEGPDEIRPLGKKGRRQAGGLVDVLSEFQVGRIISSRYVRCLETVVPLACQTRRSIEVHPALAEGSSVADAEALVAELAGTTTVLCTHGDVIWNLVVEVAGGDEGLAMAKGSTWLVEEREGRLTAVRYLPPTIRPH
jgi:broad specificity phosphatase PhoE